MQDNPNRIDDDFGFFDVKDNSKKVVFLHRLPHMKMNKDLSLKINSILYLLMLYFAYFYNAYQSFLDLISHFQDPFDQLILPGLFYYWCFREKWMKEDVDIK